MLKASDITKAIVTAFEVDPDFADFTIERGEYVNVDPNQCPWLGVYRQSINYDPETLGNGPDYWTAQAVVQLIVQAANYSSGQDVEDDLESYVEAVIDKMVEDTTIRASVDMINTINVSYSYVAQDEETVYFQAAIIEMTLEVSTS